MTTRPPPGGWNWAKIGLLWSIAKNNEIKWKKFLPDGSNLPCYIQKEGWYTFHTGFGSLSTVGGCSGLNNPQYCKKWLKLPSFEDTPPLSDFFPRQIVINYEVEDISWHGGGLLAVYKRGDDNWATPRGLKLAQNRVAMINRQNNEKKGKNFYWMDQTYPDAFRERVGTHFIPNLGVLAL